MQYRQWMQTLLQNIDKKVNSYYSVSKIIPTLKNRKSNSDIFIVSTL